MRLSGGWKYGRWLAVLMIAGFVLYQMRIVPVTVPGVAPTQAAVIVVTHDHRSLDVFDTHYEMEDGRLRLTKSSPQFANVL